MPLRHISCLQLLSIALWCLLVLSAVSTGNLLVTVNECGVFRMCQAQVSGLQEGIHLVNPHKCPMRWRVFLSLMFIYSGYWSGVPIPVLGAHIFAYFLCGLSTPLLLSTLCSGDAQPSIVLRLSLAVCVLAAVRTASRQLSQRCTVR